MCVMLCSGEINDENVLYECGGRWTKPLAALAQAVHQLFKM
jgi:hypothetical protein